MTCLASNTSNHNIISPESLTKFCQKSDMVNMEITMQCVDECDAVVEEDSYIKNLRAIISLCEKLQYDEKMTCVNEKTNLTDIEFDQLDNVCDFYSNWHQQHVASYVSCKFVAEEIIRIGNILGQMWSIQTNLDYKDLGSCVKEWPLTKIIALSIRFLTLGHENKVETCFDICGAKADDFNGKLPGNCTEFDKYSKKLDCLERCHKDDQGKSVVNKTINEIYEKNCHQSIQYKFDTFLNCYFNASKSEYVEQEDPQDFCKIRNYYEGQCGEKKKELVEVQPLIDHFVRKTAAEFYIDVDEEC